MNWTERARSLMREQGITQITLAERLGVTQGAIGHWLNGRREPGMEELRRIAEALGIPVARLVYGNEAPPSPKPEVRLAGTFEDWDSNTPLDDADVELPLYKEVEMAAGAGMQQSLEINGRKLRFAKSSLRAAGVELTNAACAIVTGNSMEPRIMDGATIGIDQAKTQVKDGRIFAIDHDGMLRVKYLYRMPGGGLRLHSENAQEHPDEMYSATEVAERIRILGWVFWISQMNVW